MQNKESKKELLLKCPFCGGEAMLTNQLAIDEYGHKLWNVLCVNCDNRTSSYWDKNHVVEKWNTRKPMQEICERLEDVKRGFCGGSLQTVYYQNGVIDAIEIVKEVGGMNEV